MASDRVEKKEDSAGDAPRMSGMSGPYAILLPPDINVWNEARRLVAEKSLRVEDLAVCASQDPAIVIELIRTANALYFSVGKSPITSVKTAIVRLGSDVVLEIFEKIKERPRISNFEVASHFEIHRSRCKRMAIIARMLAESLSRTMSEDCLTAGLLMAIGEMLAVIHLKETYVELVKDLSRTAIIYRLAQDHKFDVEKMGVNYLRKQGIPEALLFALDRESRAPSQDRAIMKPICQAAAELVDGFDTNKWEKFAPGKSLPPKSPLRSLQIPENLYLKIYERASEYLFSLKLLEEKQKNSKQVTEFESNPSPAVSEPSGANELESEIAQLLKGDQPAIEEEYQDTPAPAAPPKTKVATIPTPLGTGPAQFSLETKPKKTVARVKEAQPSRVPPPQLTSDRGSKVVSQITGMFDKAKSSEDLLSTLLNMLIKDGCFEKSALIVVSKDRKKAIVVAARGPKLGNGQTLDIDDPLSPLAQCFTKVQSWGNKESDHSPFGSKSFALAPIDADHETPVALYADCGNDGAISFEARRVFRTVVDLLNEKLPQIPGGIPNELGKNV